VPENTASLWPDAIRATVQSPQAILVAQAEALTEQTSGVLVGDVKSGFAEGDQSLLYFSILVPDLGGYRHRILVVQHEKDMHYPSMIDAEVFRPSEVKTLSEILRPLTEGNKPNNRADSDKEFIDLVRKVFQSPYVVSVAQSLIARVNDVRAGKKVDPIEPEVDSSSVEGKEEMQEEEPGDS
jgi:hypothetical protein